MNINNIIIMGRLTRDPEVKSVSDTNLASFRIASNRVVGKKKVEKTIFIDVNCWGGLGSVCGKYLSKGSNVAVEGVLCQDTWTNSEGQKNSKIYIEAKNVVFLDGGNSDERPQGNGGGAEPSGRQEQAPSPNDSDDLPF